VNVLCALANLQYVDVPVCKLKIVWIVTLVGKLFDVVVWTPLKIAKLTKQCMKSDVVEDSSTIEKKLTRP